MKLKYEIEKESTLDIETIVEKIIFNLRESNYDLERKSDKIVDFYLEGWGANAKQFDKVNGGRFEIIELGGTKSVRFKYYVSITFDLFIILTFIIASFFKGYPLLFLSAVFIIISFVRLSVAKSRCQEMLTEIVT